jgi:hypothetical protein
MQRNFFTELLLLCQFQIYNRSHLHQRQYTINSTVKTFFFNLAVLNSISSGRFEREREFILRISDTNFIWFKDYPFKYIYILKRGFKWN